MTLVPLTKLAPPRGHAATHALVIGVGNYPHLPPEDQFGDPASTWRLSQLSSPPVTTELFATWLRDEYENAAAPLGSIELLLSDPVGSEFNRCKDATMSSIRKAFKRWFARCNERETNVALFYFCGHGVQKGIKTGLVTASFRSDPQALVNDVIDFEAFQSGMEACLARRQLFVIDACRTTPAALANHNGALGLTLVTYDPAQATAQAARDNPILFAAARGTASHAQKNSPSYFTGALIRVLRGAGCEPSSMAQVMSTNVAKAINDVLDGEYHPDRRPQDARLGGESSGFVVHEPRNPVVPVRIGCDPATDNATARFRLAGLGQCWDRLPENPDWYVDLAPASYLVTANVDTEAAPRKKQFDVIPPFTRASLSRTP